MRDSTTTERIVAASGLLGAALLVAYFAAPALLGWPFAGDTPAHLAAYALSHQSLFYAGAWLQSTGTLLCVVFFVGLVSLAGALSRLPGVVLVVAAAALIAVVLIDSAFLVAVPMAASSGDLAAVSTTFGLSNGVFVRVFPLAPSTATYIALGIVLRPSPVLARPFARAALAIGVVFEVAGLASIFSSWAVIAAAVMGAAQAAWVVAAALSLWLRASAMGRQVLTEAGRVPAG